MRLEKKALLPSPIYSITNSPFLITSTASAPHPQKAVYNNEQPTFTNHS